MLHDLVDEEFTLRSWANECHLPLKYIPQLWKLIEVMSTDEGSDLRQTAIAILVELGRIILLCIHSHGSELI